MARLGMPVSDTTILRIVKECAGVLPNRAVVRVAGIDEWAWRKGMTFGTVIVDLERRQVVELLADRSAGAAADWFKKHPEIEVVSRDRAGLYADAARQGAPQARQVADRFHLLKNFRETVERQLGRFEAPIRQSAAQVEDDPDTREQPGIERSNGCSEAAAHERLLRRGRAAARKAMFDEIRALYEAGSPVTEIARKLGLGPRRVYRWVRRIDLPEPSAMEPKACTPAYFGAFLARRWAEGTTKVRHLFSDIRHRGYTGSFIPQESAQENVRGRGQGAREGAGEGAAAQGPAPDLGQTRAPAFAAAEITEAPPAAEPALAPLRQPGKAPAPAAAPKDPFVYDETWNEAEKLAGWHAGLAEADSLPPLLSALLLAHAWHAEEPIQRQARLAPLLAGLHLRARGRTKTHLASFYLGLRRLRPQERPRTPLDHLRQGLAIVEAGAREGLAQHDRLILARALLARKCRGRRETSHLPALAELLLEAPLVSIAMIAQRLAISPQAAQILVGNLGASLREITGRKRYRAWTIG